MHVGELATLQGTGHAADNVVQPSLKALAARGKSLGQYVSSTAPRTQGHGRVEAGHAPGAAHRFGRGLLEDDTAKSGVHAAGPGQAPRHSLGRLIRRNSCPHWMPNLAAALRSIREVRRFGSGRSRPACFPATPAPTGSPPSMQTVRCRCRIRPIVRVRSLSSDASVVLVIHGTRSRRRLLMARRPASHWMTCGG
jgi:hypothetical protein